MPVFVQLFSFLTLAVFAIALTVENRPRANKQIGGGPYRDMRPTKETFVISTKEANWTEAERQCVSGKMHLASVKTFRDQQKLRDLMKKHAVNVMWIGASDLAGEGNFTWVSDGELINRGYTNWAIGEPDDRADDGQDCVVVTRANRGRWFDTNCRVRWRFTCQ